MTNSERINAEIEKQINAGFTAEEIRHNLLGQQFSTAEINEGLKRLPAAAAPKKSSSKFGVLSLLVSIWFIVNGSMRLSSSPSGSFLYSWGIVLIVVGTAGVIWKGWDVMRK